MRYRFNTKICSGIEQELSLIEKKRPRITAVCSWKGGVGKTNVSVNLGIKLLDILREYMAQQNFNRNPRILVIDSDFGKSNISMLLTDRNPQFTIEDFFAKNKSLTEIAIRSEEYGIEYISGNIASERMVELTQRDIDKFNDALLTINSRMDKSWYNQVILDLSPGVKKDVSNLVFAADEILLVLEPENTALSDTYGFIKIMVHKAIREGIDTEKLLSRFRIIINSAEDFKTGMDYALRLNKIIRTVVHNGYSRSYIKTKVPELADKLDLFFKPTKKDFLHLNNSPQNILTLAKNELNKESFKRFEEIIRNPVRFTEAFKVTILPFDKGVRTSVNACIPFVRHEKYKNSDLARNIEDLARDILHTPRSHDGRFKKVLSGFRSILV